MNHELKARAKRLRSAIPKILEVPVSVAQSLELIAREENFPNWDAASACYAPRLGTERARHAETEIVSRAGSGLVLDSLFEPYPQLLADIRTLLNPQDRRGSLVLIGGLSGHGKTCTMHLLLDDMLQGRPDGSVAILSLGILEYAFPPSATVRCLDADEGVMRSDWPEQVVVFNEIRLQAHALQAVLLAQAGYKVIATMQAQPGNTLAAFRSRLSGVEPKLLDALFDDQRVLVISQSRVSHSG